MGRVIESATCSRVDSKVTGVNRASPRHLYIGHAHRMCSYYTFIPFRNLFIPFLEKRSTNAPQTS